LLSSALTVRLGEMIFPERDLLEKEQETTERIERSW
jgi:hypothetical protein